MNLRRLIVGEVRGDEAIPMLEAMSTGDGSAVHHRTPAPPGRASNGWSPCACARSPG